MKHKDCITNHKLISFLVFFLLFFNGNSQESVFSFKPVAGFNACQIHGDDASGYHKFGLNGGIMVNARLNNKTSIDLGFVFSQKGANKNQNVKNGDYTFYRIGLNYLELPLLLNYRVNKSYFITLGPSVGYLLYYNVWTDKGNLNDLYHFNKFEYGVNFGLGRTIKDNFSIEVRTSNSILPVLNYGATANLVYFPNPLARFFNKGLYNNVLSLYFIYQIKPKKKSESTN